MSDTKPIRYEQVIPDVLPALLAVHRVADTHGLERKIHHLVVLRASQMNGCAHCIKMHLREAREDGETQDRLDRVSVWDQVNDFSEAEKAALAWTEALTELDRKTDYGPLRARLRQHFSDEQIGALTISVGMINFWNRFAISSH
jgi:AhpD family alkylhydroperoxidase